MGHTTLYVDVENLQDPARDVIASTIAQWPPSLPQPNVLQLYVGADQTQLWDIWASHKFPSITPSIKGIQRYGAASKNLADMALMLDAITDLLKARTALVAILGDDSDYVALFAAICREVPYDDTGKVPFAWFLTDRPRTHSKVLNEFVPSQYIHTVICQEKSEVDTAKSTEKVPKAKSPVTPGDKQENGAKINQSEDVLIAKAIIRHITVGQFKSTDCMQIVKQNFPEHKLAEVDGAQFGTHFTKFILPILKQYGVTVSKGRPPRKYEMTQQAKSRLD